MVSNSLDSRESPGSIVRRYGSVTIAAAGTLSGAMQVDRARYAFVQTPANWDAAAVTMDASVDGTTFASLRSLSGEQSSGSITGAAVVGPFDIGGAKAIKVRSGTLGATVAQGDECVVLVTLLDG